MTKNYCSHGLRRKEKFPRDHNLKRAPPSHSTNDADTRTYCYYNKYQMTCAGIEKKTSSKNVFKTVPLVINATSVVLSTHEVFATLTRRKK